MSDEQLEKGTERHTHMMRVLLNLNSGVVSPDERRIVSERRRVCPAHAIQQIRHCRGQKGGRGQ